MQESWEIHWEDYYEIIEVSAEADADAIKKAYLYKAWLLSADRMTGAPEHAKAMAQEELKKVNNAYDTLKDTKKRGEYHEEWLRRTARRGNSNSYRNSDTSSDRPKSPPPKSGYSSYPPPRPVVTPGYFHADNVEPNAVYSSSFTITNVGGPYTKLGFTRPDSWLKIVRWSSLSASDELPMKVEIEGVPREWGKTYTEFIKVNLDEEATTVKVELTTKTYTNTQQYSEARGKSRSGGKWFAGIFAIAAIVVIAIVISNQNKPSPSYSNYAYTQTTAQTPTFLLGTVNYIQYGQTIIGSFGTNNSQHSKFLGQAGDIVTINAHWNAGQINPYVELRDPNGNLVADDWGWNDALIEEFTLVSSGTYTICVSDCGAFDHVKNPAGYRLSLTKN